MNLTVKRYNQNGLSTRLTQNGKLFRVSGPLGKSLTVDPAGLNVAFVAGTGVLPFMDLAAFVARLTIGMSNIDSQRLEQSFMFWVVAGFREKEKIGDGFLKALADANAAQFRYDVTLSGQ